MVKMIATGMLLLSLTGCGFIGGFMKSTKDVYIPVIEPVPEPPIITRPILPINSLIKEDKNDVVVKSYAESVKILQNYSVELETYLNVYRKE